VQSLARLIRTTHRFVSSDVGTLSLRIKLAVAFAVLVGVGCGASTYAYLDATLMR
jgi:hypothetical protein